MRSRPISASHGIVTRAALLLALFSGLAVAARAQLVTINETFTGTTLSSGWVTAGSNYNPTLTAATGIDAPGSGWLRLTDLNGNEATSVRDTNAFNSANATIAVKFSYAAYGGSGADGISFFLADASKTFATGAYGGSLGYANMSAGTTVISGMSGGYIGLGLDEYGNYATMNEGKHGGFGTSTALNAYPNAVSVRGPGSGQTGYDYLGGTAPFTPPFAFPNNTTRPTGTQARTFEVIITATNQMTVYMQAGVNAPMVALYSIDLSGYARPDSLIMGFTGSSGGLTDIHEVQGLSLSSQAATLWTNGGATSTWASPSNWNGYGGTIPTTGADVLFDNHFVSTAQTIDVGAGTTRSIRSLQIDAPFSYTLNNGTLEFNSQGILGPVGIVVSQGHGAAAHTINSAVVVDEAMDIKNLSSGALNITGAVATNGNAVTLNGGGSGGTNLSGVISGTGSIVKNDNGSATLSGTNTYSGGTTLNSGTLTAGSNSAFGTGSLTLNGGTLAGTSGVNVANTLALQGNAGVSNLTTSGTLTQTGGSYTLNMAGATHTGAVNLSSTNSSQTLTVNVDSGTSTISGVIRDGGTAAGNLTKTGAGTLALAGSNTYTGTTAVNDGTLQLGASNVLTNTGALTLGASGTLNLNGFSQQVGTLTAAGGATINFGVTPGANTFVFGNYVAPASGVLVITNWESGVDKLASTIANLNVGSIYISGQGVAQEAAALSAMGGTYGNAYLLTPIVTTPIEWSGASGTNVNWSQGSNWVNNVAPKTTDIVLFDGAGKTHATSTVNQAFTIAGIKFGNTAGTSSAAYNISGTRTLTLAGSVPYIQQQNNYQNQTISVSTLALNANTVMDVTGSKNLIISSIISGGVNVIKDGTGAGKLVLQGANTFSGGLFVNNGTVQAANSAALGTGATTLSDGTTLELSGGITATNAISASGLGVAGAGAINNVSGANTLSGTITEAGDTKFAAASGTTLTLSGNLTGTNTDTNLTGPGTLNIARITTGTGNVTINGGTVTFNGTTNANTYTGTTTVNTGTLNLSKSSGTNAIAGPLVIGDGSATAAIVKLAAANQIDNRAGLTINSNGTFNLNGRSETIGSFSGSGVIDNASGTAATLTFGDTTVNTFSGVIQDSSTATLSLVKQGTGKLTLTNNNTYAGTTTLSSGIIGIQANTALGTGALTVNNSGNLEVSGGITVGNTMTLNGTGTAANDGAIQNTAGNNNLNGVLTLGSATRLQADAGGTLTINGNITASNQNLTLGGGGNITVTGAITTGSGTLTKDGSGYVILAPTSGTGNSYTGATAINDGTLEIQKAAALGTTGSGTTVASGGTLAISGSISTAETPITLNGSGDNGSGALRSISGINTVSGTVSLASTTKIQVDAGSLTTSGVIAGGAGIDLTKSGSGTLNLTGTSANTFTGNLTVADGTLVLNKTGVAATGGGNLAIGDSAGAANSAVVQLGSAGQIAATTAVAINSDGKLDLNNNSQTIGALSDGTTGGGSVALGAGTLTVNSVGNTTFSGAVSGTGTVTKAGTGTLTLTQAAGSNAFAAGTLNLSAGTVQLGASNILATAVTFAGGTLSVNGFSDKLTSASVTASSAIDFNSLAGVLDLTNGTYTGGTLTINNWAGSFTGGGASQLLLPGTISGSLLANITFTGYGTGAQLIGNEIVPLTGTAYTWNLDGNGNWTTNSNWSPNSGNPNGVGQTANFTSVITADRTITLDAARTIGYLNFNDNNNYTIASPGAFKLTFQVSAGNAQLNLNGTGSDTISAGLTLNSALVINQNSAGTLTLNNANAITGTAQNLTVNGSGNTTISGIIATTTGSLTKNNGGTLTLGGANTYTGGTTINGGVVAIAADNNLGATTGALTLNGGTLENTAAMILNSGRTVTINANGGTFQTDANLSYSGAVAGTGTLNKTGAGTFTISGNTANTHSGAVNVNAGTLEYAKAGAVGAIGDSANVTVASGATLKFTGTGGYNAETIGSLAGAGTVNNASTTALALTTGGNNASTLFSGVLQNSGAALSLTKNGTGTMTLTGANTYTGTTTVNAGTLNIQNSSALGTTAGGTTVANGAALELQGGLTVGAETLSLSGTGVSSNGALRNVSGTNSLGGAITLGAATTIKSEAGALTLSGNIGGAAQNLTLDGAGNITLAGVLGTTTGTLTKNGTGYVVLSGANTFTGATTINAGTVELQNASALGGTGSGATVANGATLALSGAATNFSADPLTLNGYGVGSQGALRNLSGINTYSGAITLNSSSIIGVDNYSTLIASGVISDTSGGTLTKAGAGTLVLSGANTYSGPTNIIGGLLQVSSDGNLGALPGAVTPAEITLNGGTLEATATMTLDPSRGVTVGGAGGGLSAQSGVTLTYAGVIAGSSGGALTKTGNGTVALSGANTFNGAINVNAGTLQISSDGNLGGGTAVNLAGGTLNTTASLTTSRTVNVSGTSGLTVNDGTTLTFGGSLTGSGTLAVNLNSTGALTFNNSINFSSGNMTLTGGTLSLAGVNLTLGSLHITGNTVLDFGNSAASVLNVGTFTVDAGVSVTVTNWVNMVDYFYATNFTGATAGQSGGTPENQITFTSPTTYSNNSTNWTSWDHEITPAPEPATYGLIFLGSCVSFFGWRRWRKSKVVPAAS